MNKFDPILGKFRQKDAGEGVATSHGSLSGLTNDDHTQYHNDTRGDARYFTQAQSHALFDFVGNDGEIQFKLGEAAGSDPGFKFDPIDKTFLLGDAPVDLPNVPFSVIKTVLGYFQSIFQNKDSSNSSSTDIVLNADDGDDSTYYLNMGINSSTYNQAEFDSTGARDGYIFKQDDNLVIGTGEVDKKTRFVAGGFTDADVQAEIVEGGVNLPTGKTYQINGVNAIPSANSDLVNDVCCHAGFEQNNTIIDNGNNTIDVPANVANFLVDGVIMTLAVASLDNHTVADDVPTFVVGDYNGGSPVFDVVTDESLIDYALIIPYAELFKRTGSASIHIQRKHLRGHGEVEQNNHRLEKTHKYSIESGALTGMAVDTSLNITMLGGGVWVCNFRYEMPAVTTATRQFKCLNTNGVWTYTTNTSPVLNNTQYNDPVTGYQTLGDGKYGITYVYRGVEDPNHIYTFLGEEAYDSLEIAQASKALIGLPPAVNHAVFVGRIIVLKSATTVVCESAFDTVFQASTAITIHNLLSGRDDADTHPIAAVTDLQAELDGKVTENIAITGATKTKITYDAKGLVTSGADATQDDIGDGTTYKQYSATEKTKLAGIETGAEVNNISDANATDLTDGGTTTLHSHAGIGGTAFTHGMTFDGGGQALSTGSKGYYRIPADWRVIGWSIYGKKGETGSVVVDIKKSTHATLPTSASIAGSEKPTISSDIKGQDVTLSTWTTDLVENDILEYNIDSVSTFTRVTIFLHFITY